MKKIFLGISMMLLSAISFTAAAQAQNQEGEKQCPKKEQCEKSKKDCCKKRDGKKCDAKCAEVKCNKENCDKAGCANAAECAKAADCAKADKKCCKGDSVNGRRFDKKCRPDGFRGDHGRMGEDRGCKGRAQLFNGIDLSEEQKAQIEALDKKMAEERKALKDEEKVNRTEAKAEMKKAKEAARETYENALKEILTEEQYVKYESNREAMKVRMGARKEMGKLKGDMSRARQAGKAGVRAAKQAAEASK